MNDPIAERMQVISNHFRKRDEAAEFVRLREEIDQLKQALFDCARIAGADTDGDTTHHAIVDVASWAIREVTELREALDEADAENCGCR